jgi:hypothetical protein
LFKNEHLNRYYKNNEQLEKVHGTDSNFFVYNIKEVHLEETGSSLMVAQEFSFPSYIKKLLIQSFNINSIVHFEKGTKKKKKYALQDTGFYLKISSSIHFNSHKKSNKNLKAEKFSFKYQGVQKIKY